MIPGFKVRRAQTDEYNTEYHENKFSACKSYFVTSQRGKKITLIKVPIIRMSHYSGAPY